MSKFATIYGLLGKGKELIFEDKVITDNGLYGAAEGYDAIGSVAVNVPHVDSLIDGSIVSVDSNVSKVISYCFRGCRQLKTVNLPEATTIETYAFYNADGLTDLRIPKVTSLPANAIEGCTALQSIHAPLVQTIHDNMHRFFNRLTDVNYASADGIGNYAFSGCGFTRINKTMFTNALAIGQSAFEGCPVTYADFQNVTAINSGAFQATSLKVLVLRSSVRCNLYSSGGNVFPSSLQYIYVRKSLLSSYQSLANSSDIWNLQGLLGKIRAIEDYSDDGTVNGNIPG